MKKYQWNSIELKKKNNKYGWYTLAAMAVALLSMLFMPNFVSDENTPFWIALGFMGLALIFMVITWKAQSDDKKLKR